MPRRWATDTRFWVYRFLSLRDGECCADCMKSPQETKEGYLDIDHLNHAPHDNRPENLQLLCRSCNTAKGNGHRSQQARLHDSGRAAMESPSVQRERERERTRVLKEAIDYQAGPPEMRANQLYEVPYITNLIALVRERDHVTKETAINGMAQLVGCSIITAGKYLAKLTSEFGPLEETRDMLQTPVIVLRDRKEGEDHHAQGRKAPRVRGPKGKPERPKEASPTEEPKAPQASTATAPAAGELDQRLKTIGARR